MFPIKLLHSTNASGPRIQGPRRRFGGAALAEVLEEDDNGMRQGSENDGAEGGPASERGTRSNRAETSDSIDSATFADSPQMGMDRRHPPTRVTSRALAGT